MGKVIELAGSVFGQLIALRAVEHTKREGSAYWLCLCTCGASHIVRSDNLRSGSVKRCKNCQSNLRTQGVRLDHGLTDTPTYKSWISMRYRCTNQKYSEYKYYGGRGITVCERWIDSFENFLADMGERPKGKSLDRIDPYGNYCPENCRWATAKEQANNKRTTGGKK